MIKVLEMWRVVPEMKDHNFLVSRYARANKYRYLDLHFYQLRYYVICVIILCSIFNKTYSYQ